MPFGNRSISAMDSQRNVLPRLVLVVFIYSGGCVRWMLGWPSFLPVGGLTGLCTHSTWRLYPTAAGQEWSPEMPRVPCAEAEG